MPHRRPADRPRHRLLPLLLVALLSPTGAQAIVDIEDAAVGRADAPFSAEVDLALRGASGNSERLGLSADLGMQWRRGPHQTLLWLSYDYGSSRKVRDANRGFAHLRRRYHLSSRVALEGFGQWQRDEFARLNRRILLGGGLRLTRAGQHLGIGAFHEEERITPAAGDPQPPDSRLWRGNLYLALRRDEGGVLLGNTLYFQPALRHSGDWRLLDEATATIPIAHRLALKMSLEIRQDHRPPQGVKPTDLRYTTALHLTLP
ncbi:MAG: DUF481 domain-containing protein [Zetaproteobacteria bacterium]|nr:MAG: DUF481 domain-containing protein [Zetaproteobacteria bacterium]